MDMIGKRLRLLYPDIHGLERGKYLFDEVADEDVITNAGVGLGVALDPAANTATKPFLIAGQGGAEGVIVAVPRCITHRPGTRITWKKDRLIEGLAFPSLVDRFAVGPAAIRVKLGQEVLNCVVNGRVEVLMLGSGEEGPAGDAGCERLLPADRSLRDRQHLRPGARRHDAALGGESAAHAAG